MSNDEYLEVRLDIPPVYLDAVTNFIVENIATGVVLEEEEDSPTTGLIFYVDDLHKSDYKSLLSEYFKKITQADLQFETDFREKLIKKVDWVEKYKESVKAVKINEDIYVRPSWVEPDNSTKYDIIIEPKMAFGTGSHETTHSCLLAMYENFKSGMSLLDLGTGSGILSIFADKVGASYIKAIDYDITAVDNCKENFSVNNLKAEHDIVLGTIEKCLKDNPYDFVCSNIIKSTILPILPDLINLTKQNGYLILSGLLLQDEEEISSELQKCNQGNFTLFKMNNWITYTINKV